MPTLEEIVYDPARAALADQEAVVAGIRQRAGTLLAAHALVASFLGATTVHARGLHFWAWAAIATLVAGLVIAAVCSPTGAYGSRSTRQSSTTRPRPPATEQGER
jgi:hypothetical protein